GGCPKKNKHGRRKKGRGEPAFKPKAMGMAKGNNNKKKTPREAGERVKTTRSKTIPKGNTAPDANQAKTGIMGTRRKQFSVAVYVIKCAKSPQATCGAPRAPHNPKRSATAERKEKPRANRANGVTTVSLAFINSNSFSLPSICCSADVKWLS